MKIESVSLQYQLALANGDSVQSDFASIKSMGSEPIGDGVGAFDGYWPQAWQPEQLTHRCIKVLPFARAGAGSNFNFRVYDWTQASKPPYQTIWVPTLLAEFACITCNSDGPAFMGGGVGETNAIVDDSHSFCDTITLVQGDLGIKGRINSTGPQTDLIAYVILEIQGAQKISFDFAWQDVSSQAQMNALWKYVS